MGPWSSTAACVVGATGYRGGLLVRRAACHFGGMRGAVAIFDIKNTGMPRIINTLAQLLIIDMLCPVVSLDFRISLSIEREKFCSDMPVSPYLHHWYMLLDREDVPSVEASSFFVPLAEGRHPVPVFL